MSHNSASRSLYQTLKTTKWTLKNCYANKFLKSTMHPFKSSFKFAVLVIPSFNVSINCFFVSLNLVVVL